MRWVALAVVLAIIATTAPGVTTAQQAQKVYHVGVLTASPLQSGSPFLTVYVSWAGSTNGTSLSSNASMRIGMTGSPTWLPS